MVQGVCLDLNFLAKVQNHQFSSNLDHLLINICTFWSILSTEYFFSLQKYGQNFIYSKAFGLLQETYSFVPGFWWVVCWWSQDPFWCCCATTSKKDIKVSKLLWQVNTTPLKTRLLFYRVEEEYQKRKELLVMQTFWNANEWKKERKKNATRA